jgi:putative molybdopterin biosynthesis protein
MVMNIQWVGELCTAVPKYCKIILNIKEKIIMDDMRHIESYRDLNIISDHRRLAILRLLMRSSKTLSQLGEALGMSAARVRHHVKVLEEAGMVELVRTQPVRGFLEKYYQATSRAIFIHKVILPQPARRGTINVIGSHDLALELLANLLGEDRNSPDLQIIPVGSLDGLVALRQGFCQVTGCHLYDPVSAEYNTPYIRYLFPDQHMHIITLVHRQQGLLVSPGNPLGIQALDDLSREDVTFINRKGGSGTRLWLDRQLQSLSLKEEFIKGYDREVNTHTQVASAVLNGEANAGLGVLAAALKFKLDFIPLFNERFDLVIRDEHYHSDLLLLALEYLQTAKFRKEVRSLGGYDPGETGKETYLS